MTLALFRNVFLWNWTGLSLSELWGDTIRFLFCGFDGRSSDVWWALVLDDVLKSDDASRTQNESCQSNKFQSSVNSFKFLNLQKNLGLIIFSKKYLVMLCGNAKIFFQVYVNLYYFIFKFWTEQRINQWLVLQWCVFLYPYTPYDTSVRNNTTITNLCM